MSKLFQYGCIIFIVMGLMLGKQELMFQTFLQTPFQVFDLTKSLILSTCLWNGVLSLLEESKIIVVLQKICHPFFSWVYGSCIENQDLYDVISLNFFANMLGLGTLATLSGLKAMKLFHHYHQRTHIMMFVVLNTVGFSVLPTTLMTLRQNASSHHVLAFYPFSLITGIVVTTIGIFIVKVVEHV